jgi:hypothetical protein
MRKIIVIATALATALSAISPTPGWAFAAASLPAGVTIDPVVAATFDAFPNGGPELSDRIRDLILQNNNFAADVARALEYGDLSPEQRAAAEKGLAEALTRLGIYPQEAGVGGNTQLLMLIAGLAGAGGIAALALSKNKKTTSPN